MFKQKPTRTPEKVRQLESRVAELTAEVEKEKLRREVVEAERDNLAAVVARERERVKAETAEYAERRARAEGKQEG